MFNAKIRPDGLLIDVNDSEIATLATYSVRNSDLEIVSASLLAGTNQDQSTYTLLLAEPISIGTWQLVKIQSTEVTTCNLIWADEEIVPPQPQEVLNFISWVGEAEAIKLSDPAGQTLSYNVIATALEQATIELDYLLSGLPEGQKEILAPNRDHMIRVIARYRLDRICPRPFVKKDYEDLIASMGGLNGLVTGGRDTFAPTFIPQSRCSRRGRCC